MITSKETCSGCQKDKYIVNKKYVLCDDCNYKRTHNGKSKLEVSIEKQKSKPRKVYKSNPKIKKPTGERDLFLEIWNEREHYCEKGSECLDSKFDRGVWLGLEPKAFMFSHVKPKSTHSELRLVKSNIELICFKCHFKHEFQGK